MVSFKNILKVTCVLSTLIYNAFAAPSIINKRNGILSKLTPAVNELTHLPPSNKVPARGTVTGQTPEEFAQIKKHAGIAISSYCNDVNQWRCESCRESVPDGHIVASFKTLKYDMTGFILHSDRDQTIYLVFRGTMSIRNIIPDALMLFKDYENVKGAFVQEGFHKAHQEVSKKYLPILLKHVKLYPTYKVVVTGHSLGASVATIAAPKLYEIDKVRFGPSSMRLYTYGSPRVGNEVFAKYLVNTGIYVSRSVHKNDIVTSLPTVSAGFLHVGIETHIDKDPDVVRVCTSKLESSLCSSSLKLSSFIDHSDYYGYSTAKCWVLGI